MRIPIRPSHVLRLAALAAVTISCNDSPTGPSRNAPDGSIALSDSVFTRGQVVQARVGAPAGYSVVPGTVNWTVVAGGATLTDVGAGDTVDVALTGAGSVQLRVSYTLRSLGVGSSLTIAGPTRRPGGDIGVEGVRTMLVAAPLLDYTVVPPASVTAGATLGNVQVALKDSRGRVITTANDSIVIGLDPTSGAPGATLLGTLRARPTNGVATFAGMSIQKAGVGYRLIASSPTLASRDTATTTVVAGAPSAAQSTLAVADTIRSVGQTTTVTVTLRDEYGNPVLTATPASFTPSASAGTLGSFTCANGICTATYTAPNTPGTPVIGATIGGTQITGGPKTITVTPGPAAKLVITGLNAQTAGTAQNITITAYDAFGNVATSYTGAKDLTFSGASVAPNGTTQPTVSAASFAATTGITFVNGVATNVPMILYKVETATISVSDGTIATTGSDRLPVTVTAAVPSPTTVGGGASGVTSSLTISRDTVALGETLTVTVKLFDLYGNPILNATPSAFVATPSAGTLGAFTCVDGVCTATYTAPNTPGAPTIGVTIGGTPVGGSPKTVQVVDRTPPTITGPSGAAGDATSVKSVPENTTAVHTFTANEAVTWSLDGGTDAAKFAIDPATGALTFVSAPDFENPADSDGNNTYVVVVKATDAAGNISTQTLTVTVTNVDDTGPAITGPSGAAGDATSAKSVPENTTAVHTFTANEPVTWSLATTDDGAKFAIDPATGALTFIAPPDFEAPTDGDNNNTYIVTVRATDAAGNISMQTLTVTVTNVDDTGPAITGPSGAAGAAASAKSVAENTTAVHTFTANEAVTWSLDGGDDAAKFAIDPTTGALTFIAPPDFETPTDVGTNNTYVVVVKATDATGNISMQTLTVTVTNVDDTAPAITGPSGAAGDPASAKSVAENTTAVHTFTANEAVTWSLDGGTDAAKFAIDPATGALTFVSAPDFENPADSDGNNTYVVVVKATDAAGNISTQTLTVTVTNVDDIAALITGPSGGAGSATSGKLVPENTTAVHTFTANEAVTWSLNGGEDAAKFAVNPSTGALTFISAPDFEAPTDGATSGTNTYVVVVKATDAAGNVSTQTVTVTVTDVDDSNPLISGPSGSAGATASVKSVPENSTPVHTFTANEAVTWSLDGGEDASKFSINPSTGALTFQTAPDFEAATDGATSGTNTYIVVVKATDAAGNISTQTLTVTVTDVNETGPPLVNGPSGGSGAASSAVSIVENTTAVFSFTSNKPAVTWSLNGGADAAKFSINPATGALTFNAAPDFEAPNDLGDGTNNNTYVVIVRATDVDGANDQTVTVTVTNAPELVLTASAQPTLAVSEVSERIIFTVRSGATRQAVTSATTFSLSATGGGTFFSDVNGTIPVSSVIVPAAADSFVVYYRQTSGAGTNSTVSATRSAGDVVATGAATIAIVAAAPAASRLSGIVCKATTGNSNDSQLAPTIDAVTNPCTATAGQLLMMVMSHSPTGNPYDMPNFATPTGWTKLREERVGTAGTARQLRTYVFYKVATTTGDQSVTFSTGTGGAAPKVRMTYIIAAINSPNATPVDLDAVASTMTPTAGISVPSVNATANGSMLFSYVVQDIGSNAYVAPAGLSTVGQAGQGGQAVTMIIFSKDRIFSGPTPVYTTGTAQIDAPSTGGVVVLRPQ